MIKIIKFRLRNSMNFSQFFLRMEKKGGILEFFLRPTMFKYHTDSIGKIWI